MCVCTCVCLDAYSDVPNKRTGTFIFFALVVPTVRGLLGTVCLLFKDSFPDGITLFVTVRKKYFTLNSESTYRCVFRVRISKCLHLKVHWTANKNAENIIVLIYVARHFGTVAGNAESYRIDTNFVGSRPEHYRT